MGDYYPGYSHVKIADNPKDRFLDVVKWYISSFKPGSSFKNFSHLEAKPSIIALTETWLKPYSNTACYELNGYQELIAVSRKKRGGGVAFYVGIGKRAKKVLEFVSEDTQMLTIFVDGK